MKIIYTIKDEAIESFGQPFFARADGEARRLFVDEVNNPESMIHKHPEDYSLWKIGKFDETTGQIETEIPERMTRALEVKENIA